MWICTSLQESGNTMVKALRTFLGIHSFEQICDVMKKNGWNTNRDEVFDHIYLVEFDKWIKTSKFQKEYERWNHEEYLVGLTKEENDILAQHDNIWNIMCDMINDYISTESEKIGITIPEKEE